MFQRSGKLQNKLSERFPNSESTKEETLEADPNLGV